MGRFERRPDNLRGKGDPYGSAESAIRAITEELQIIQRGVLKSPQEDVKRLQADKERLTKDIQDLQEEKGQPPTGAGNQPAASIDSSIIAGFSQPHIVATPIFFGNAGKSSSSECFANSYQPRNDCNTNFQHNRAKQSKYFQTS